jgi:uncharacterized glyoxalase superfamily protein PhnB
VASTNPVTEGMHTVTPYLVFEDAAKALDFYARAFGAEERFRMPSPDGKTIWHAEMRIGDSIVMMSDMMGGPARPPRQVGALTSTLWLASDDCDAAFRRALDAGAKGTMEPADMFWGDRVCCVEDPFGYQWNIATHVRDVSMDEMKRAGEQWARENGMAGDEQQAQPSAPSGDAGRGAAPF